MSNLVGQMLGQYRLVEQIGQGGMATVYRALDTRSLQDVAIKILSSSAVGDRRYVRRFRREAGFVKNVLRHPNIVPVLDYNELRGLVYLVMPFIDGETLHDRMSRRRVSDAEAARWIDQVANALDFAHSQGIIHRDIKPSNIIVDKEGNAHLTDFGLARMIEGSNTLTGSMLMGTPSYVSPEQGRGKHVDGRADEYSMGVVMYQLAAGRVPFEGSTPMATVLMHIQEPVARPSRYNPNLSPAVEKVILKAMAKDPEERFPTVAGMNLAYQAAVKGSPQTEAEWLQLRGPSDVAVARQVARTAEQDERRGRRSPVVWLLAGAALALAVGGVVAATALSSLGAPAAPSAVPSQPPPTSVQPVAALVSPAAPATATPAVSVGCPQVSLLGFERDGNEVRWAIYNGQEQTAIQVTDFLFGVPEGQSLVDVRLGSTSLRDPDAADTGSPIPELVTLGSEVTTVAPGATLPLALVYAFADAAPGYQVIVIFEEGCSVETVW
jgi:tRNA A-37 threonylcarbamoyl transferase component Bud32